MAVHLPFAKMSGAGNDFIVLAQEDCRGVDPGWLAARLCTRALSIGADGLIVVGPPAGTDVRIRFFNPDGSPAEMCGNGSRCAARYAAQHGLVPTGRFRLLTDSGALEVIARDDGQYEVAMPEPRDIALARLIVEGPREPLTVHAVRVGVPHAVVLMADVEQIDDAWLIETGRMLRHHPAFPEGVNTNFATLRPDGAIRQRTYERGVEYLTKACGTGATATVTVARALLGIPDSVDVIVDGGRVRIELRGGRPWLIGDARVVATGTVGPDALEW